MNKTALIEEEINYLISLQDKTKKSLLHYYLINEPTKLSIDIAKSLAIIDRMFDAEIEYINENPDDYISIYGLK
jgi:hypothetical protein